MAKPLMAAGRVGQPCHHDRSRVAAVRQVQLRTQVGAQTRSVTVHRLLALAMGRERTEIDDPFGVGQEGDDLAGHPDNERK